MRWRYAWPAALALLLGCGSPAAPPASGLADAAPDASVAPIASTVAGIETHEGRAPPLEKVEAKSSWEATYAPGAMVLEGLSEKAFVGYARESGVLTLMQGALPSTPKTGQVLLVPGHALVEVMAMKTRGRDVVLQTRPASLDRVIQDGDFSFQSPVPLDAALVTFDGGSSPFIAQSVGDLDKTQFGSKDGIKKWKATAGDLTYLITATPKPGKLEIEAKVIKKKGKRAALAYVAKATVNNLVLKGGGTYRGGKLSRLELKQEDLDVDLELSIEAAGAGMGKVDLTLPEPAITFPITVGPLILTAKVGLKLIGSIKLPGKASARAFVKFKYRGDTELDLKRDAEIGAEVKGQAGGKVDAKVSAKGDTKVIDIKAKPFDSANFIGMPVDAQFGIAVPRVSLSLFGTGFVPYWHLGFIAGSKLQWGPLCKSGYIKVVNEVGYDFSILGASLRKDKLLVSEKGLQSPEKGCPKKKK